MEKIRVLELFCGIGGLHWGLKEIGVEFEIVAALEINPTVLETYAVNFPDVRIVRRNIESLTAEEINEMNIDALVMSPPCQPFCRAGNKQGLLDKRSSPLINLLQILPRIRFKYIFVENVKGFETSDAHGEFVDMLTKIGFRYQEFLLSPVTLGIPNSRLRYYLIGKHSDLQWSFDLSDQVLDKLPETSGNNPIQLVKDRHRQRWLNYREKRIGRHATEGKLHGSSSEKFPSKYLESATSKSEELWYLNDILEPNEFIFPEHKLSLEKLRKYWSALDIVTPFSTTSCCFTKAYFYYLTGSGSILDINGNDKIESDEVRQSEGKFRYFTPREVSRLMCYPEEFKFPSNHSLKQKYKALGNSVNVSVVALMFALLFS